jgi:hypothetical protein
MVKVMKTRTLPATGLALFALLLGTSEAWADECILYEHRDFGGYSLTLYPGHRLIAIDNDFQTTTTTYDSAWNDDISSFRTTGSCELTVWEHVNEDGDSWRTTDSYRYVGDAWNDTISEALCVC